jgi:hypothetical protein
MSVMVEGGAVSAAAVGLARRRTRRTRVRREPIDVGQLAADFAEPTKRTELELIAALEAEVERVNRARATTSPEPTEPAPVPVVDVVDTPLNESMPQVIDLASRKKSRAPEPVTAGLPLEQVRAWLEQVKDDLRKVQARVEYLQFEQTRLQSQHHLVAELMSSTSAI